MQLQGAWGQGCKRQRSKYGVKDTGQGGSQVPAPAPQENGLSAPRSNFSSKPPNLELYMNLLSSRMSCLPCEVTMSCTLPPSHLWVGTWSPLSYLPPETWCLGPFRYRALKSNQAGTGLKQEALGSSAGKAGGQLTGLRGELRAPGSLGLPDSSLSCLSLCVGLTPLCSQAPSIQGGNGCQWPNISACIFTAANPRGRKEGSSTARREKPWEGS